MTHYGRLIDVCLAITALFTWMGAHGCTASGPCRELHLFGRENDLFSKDDLVIEMQFPIGGH